jgi:predicted nucleic acid-binding protein
VNVDAWVLIISSCTLGSIKASLEKILSYQSLDVLGFDESDLMVGANNMAVYGLDFNDGVNVALVANRGVSEICSNDHARLGKMEFLKLVFE